MITKEQFLASALQEINSIKHLYGKITPEMLDYRPTPKQRSTLELLQYIGHFVEVEAKAIYSGEPITDFPELIKHSSKMTFENFPKAMDNQAEILKDVLGKLTDGQLKQEIDLFGRGMKQPRSAWFLHPILKNLVAYKMQLFLYLKSNGKTDLTTSNLWQGRDPQK